MFYKQFLKITDVLDEKFVDAFDFWLATLSKREAKTISISTIASRFEVKYGIAEAIVKFAEKEGILKKRYVVLCGNEECDFFYGEFEADEVVNLLGTTGYCHNCSQEFAISYENTVVVYSKEKEPNIPESKIQEEIEKRIKCDENSGNFTLADSLANHINEVYDLYYSPEESAYKKMEKMKKELDNNFPTTTLKGQAYEKLVLCMFQQIKTFEGTDGLRTYTNQFDCIIKCPIATSYPSIFQKLSPYILIECKNEKSTPSNTYFHKLSDIMATDDAQIGIVFSRKPPSIEDMQIAYYQYLNNRNLPKQRYLLSMSDKDLIAIIDGRANLLEYLDFKLIELTTNGRNATFEMFKQAK